MGDRARQASQKRGPKRDGQGCNRRVVDPALDVVKTLGGQILKLNGFVNPYSQVKWIFSIKMAQDKALVLLQLISHAKMASDRLRTATPAKRRAA